MLIIAPRWLDRVFTDPVGLRLDSPRRRTRRDPGESAPSKTAGPFRRSQPATSRC